VVREPRHLREIAHRRLADVRLPVGIGGERRSGIECEIGRHVWQPLRIPRQPHLQPQYRVEHQHRYQAERQHRQSVFRPAHLVRFVDVGQAIDQALERPQDGIEKGALAGEHSRHEPSERNGDERHRRQEQRNLKPAIGGHVRTSPGAASRRPGR
jgi:hypothetical protein